MYRLITTVNHVLDEAEELPLTAYDEPAVYLVIENEDDADLQIRRAGESESVLTLAQDTTYLVGPFHGPSLSTVSVKNPSGGEAVCSVGYMAYTGRFTQDAATGVRQRVIDGALPFEFRVLAADDSE